MALAGEWIAERRTGSLGKAHLRELTSLRFLAAMAVLLGHFGPFIRIGNSGFDFAGGVGVSFFFVLSGFILTYRYWEDFAPEVGRPAYRRYIVARVARVYPSYVLALVLITVMYVLLNAYRPGIYRYPDNAVASWLANLFALQTFAPGYDTQQVWNAPSWSISTELFFYAAFPFLALALARHFRGGRRLAAFAALAVAYGLVMQAVALLFVFRLGWDRRYWVDIIASRNILWRLPEFLTGMVAARLLYGGHLPALRSAIMRNAVLLAGVALTVVLNTAPWPADDTLTVVMRQLRLDVLSMLPFGAIIVASAAGPTLLSPTLARRSWVFLGDVSYGIYIYHWIPWTFIAIAIDRGVFVSNSLLAFVIFATIMFAAASYIWYERPIRLYLRGKLGR
jgi:peptidoglycan/LPS O-acetylase OafA/YrhL